MRTLSHAVERDQIHHAYLFVGSRGTGKTSMAKILASCLNCDNGPTVSPCGVCASCVSIASASSLDVIEMDAASNNSVDDIRELREKVGYAPVSGKHKVYILDEAHMLSTSAWNAFLKTLEEPPPRTVFVLATTEANKVLPTVVDRCHRFDFGRPSAEQVATVVRRVSEKEGITIDEGAAALVARHATGSFRDALGTLEQLVTYAGDEAIKPQDVLDVLGVADAEQLFAAVDAIIARDPAAALRSAAVLAASGRDPGQVLRDLETHGRELLTVQILHEVPAELRVTSDRDARLLEQSTRLGDTDAVRLIEQVSAALEATANGAQPRIQLELVLIKCAAPETDPSISALLARIERLEKGAPAAPQVSAGVEAASVARPAPVPAPTPQATNAEATPAETSVQPPEAPVATPEPIDDEPDMQALAEYGAVAVAEEEFEPEPNPQVEPETEPAIAQPAVVSGLMPLSEMVKLWPAVVEMVRGANAMLAVLLDGARPIAVNESELVISFPAEAEFYKRKAEQDEHRRATMDAVRNVTGMSLAMRYELADAGDDAGAELITEPEPLSADELVQRFVDEFGAEEIHDTDQEA